MWFVCLFLSPFLFFFLVFLVQFLFLCFFFFTGYPILTHKHLPSPSSPEFKPHSLPLFRTFSTTQKVFSALLLKKKEEEGCALISRFFNISHYFFPPVSKNKKKNNERIFYISLLIFVLFLLPFWFIPFSLSCPPLPQ